MRHVVLSAVFQCTSCAVVEMKVNEWVRTAAGSTNHDSPSSITYWNVTTPPTGAAAFRAVFSLKGTVSRPNCASHETKQTKPNVINGPRFREYGGVPQRTPELSEGRTSGGCDTRLTLDNPGISEKRPFADLRACNYSE